MKPFYLILITILSFGQLAYAQTDVEIDSVKRELKKVGTNDSVQIALYLDIAFKYRNLNLDSMKRYANNARLLGIEVFNINGQLQGLRNVALAYINEGKPDTAIVMLKQVVSEARGFGNKAKSNLADGLNSLGRAYYSISKYDSAILIFEESAEVFEELGRPIDVAGALLNIGATLESKGDAVRAINYLNDALLVFEKENHDYGKATAAYYLANIFEDQQDYKKALQYFTQVAEIDSTLGNLRDFANSLNRLAGLSLSDSDTLRAISNYKRATKIYETVGARCEKANPINGLGNLYVAMNRLDSGFYYLNMALDIAISCDNKGQIASSRSALGKYYLATNNIQKALSNYLEAYEIDTALSSKEGMSKSAFELYEIYKTLGQSNKALYYLEISRKYENELFNQDRTRKIAQLEGEYELEKERQKFEFEKERESLAYQKSLKEKRTTIYIVVVGLVLVSILLIVMFRLYAQKGKINKQLNDSMADLKESNEEISHQTEMLSKRSDELERLNEEKNTIIGIIAHDLKSPLNQIKGLVSLMKHESDAKQSAEYIDKLEISANRSVEMIDRILDINAVENQGLTVKKENTNLNSLINTVAEDYKPGADKKKIGLVVQNAEQVNLETDPLLVREIMDNLISNALKFSPSDSKVTISLNTARENYTIAVEDQGPGVSVSDQKKIFNKYARATAQPTGDEKSTGLGLAIVKRYADALGYQVKCESDGKLGTTFSLIIPS
ncbi:tetratricopeptide repeat protein [Fulvivirga lutimaris]|uniref:ATP-binding protein n=1 Tax=Fulvivirga lutimaris TaxID=1819566 RepID=UPI0012BD0365|nr:tetratricopeptide repeat protein [Fulvivirga lutimaris]MTI40031.1 tetratricopeptide repeat protein [Fulvivirga lutimaris]